MANIFLSYARKDADRARGIAAALEAHGWSVWWDPEIRPGQSFISMINTEINAATCIVVLWSRHSVVSRWVLEEAHNGLNRGILCPVLIDRGPQLPVGFATIQYVEMTDWQNNLPTSGTDLLIEEVEQLIGRPRPALTPQVVAKERQAAAPGRPVEPSESIIAPSPTSEPINEARDLTAPSPAAGDEQPKRTESVRPTVEPSDEPRRRLAGQRDHDPEGSGFIDFSDLSVIDYPIIALLVATFSMTLADVVARNVFNAPLWANFELATWFAASAALFGGSIAVRNGRSIVSPVSIIVRRALGSVATWLEGLPAVAVYSLMAYFIVLKAQDSFNLGETSASSVPLLKWPLLGGFAMAFLLMALYSLARVARGLLRRRGAQ